jgi:hypothetical protein
MKKRSMRLVLSPFRSCRARIATQIAISKAAASTPKNGPKFTTLAPWSYSDYSIAALPLACEGRRLLPQADHPRRDRRPHSGFALFLVTVELPACNGVVDSDQRLARP